MNFWIKKSRMLNIYTKHPAENLWPIFSDSSQTEHCEQLSIQSEFLVTSCTSTNDLAPPPGKLYMGRLCAPRPPLPPQYITFDWRGFLSCTFYWRVPSPSGSLQFPSHSTLDYHYIIERVDCTYALISYPDLTLSYAYFPWPQEIWVRDYLCPTDWTTNHFESSEVEATSRKTRPGLLTPLDKFRGGLGYVSVSDLTAQFWCEQQMEYNFLAPEPKPETVQMQLGKDIHMARGKLVNKFNFLKLFITWIWVHIIHF